MNVSSIATRRFESIPVASVFEDLVQLRTEYDEEPLGELGDSMTDEGLLQPILVAALGDGNFELIIGSRRLRAAKRNGHSTIEAIVIEGKSPLNYILMALAENLHREDLNAFEEARAFLRLMKDYGLGVEQVAEKTKKGSQYVTSRIQLLSLPEEVQALIASKSLGLGFVSVLAKLPTGDEQVWFAKKATSDRLTPPELRALINREQGAGVAPRSSTAQLSAEKIRLRIEMFTTWLVKVPRKTVVKRLNATERGIIGQALYALEIEIRTLRHAFTGERIEPVKRAMSPGNLVEAPRNAGAEWPAGDLDKIMASDRPSDEELGRLLGRTPAAIRAMRSSMKSTSRKAG